VQQGCLPMQWVSVGLPAAAVGLPTGAVGGAVGLPACANSHPTLLPAPCNARAGRVEWRT
jgi:hypothetical protein